METSATAPFAEFRGNVGHRRRRHHYRTSSENANAEVRRTATPMEKRKPGALTDVTVLRES
jgi:hypothetical protein